VARQAGGAVGIGIAVPLHVCLILCEVRCNAMQCNAMHMECIWNVYGMYPDGGQHNNITGVLVWGWFDTRKERKMRGD